MTPQTQASDGKRARKKPESLRIREVSPTFTVNNLQKSLAWYRDVLGFVVDESWEEEGKVVGVSLRAGSAVVNLTQDDGKKGKNRVKGLGIRLFLTTAQDIDEIANSIKSRGGRLDSEPTDMPRGARVLSVVDPDGFKLTIGTGG
jgi:uncharacterized glyoxalase superfamily protein PhnB